MFKSIEYKLIFHVVLLIGGVSASTYLILKEQFVYVGLSLLLLLLSLRNMYMHYKKFNQNILFLLNAIDNGDYSFHFTQAKLSKREKELNHMLNRIKEILAKARKEVIENEKFLSLIVESITTGIIILDENNNIVTTNKASTELLGLQVFTHLNQLKSIDESLPDLFRNLQPDSLEQISIANEREEIDISIRISKLTIKRGTMRIVTLNNIGNELEAKEMESWIRLIRVMTHEIMNSIAPITSLSETLLFCYKNDEIQEADTSLKKNTVEAFETIHSTAKGLLSFVESYRKFTGIPKPEVADFSIAPLIEKIIHLESFHLDQKNIGIQVVYDNPSLYLKADESQITQILINLIKNAIEALPADGSGKIQIRIIEIDNKIQIDVYNNGDPIAPDIAAHIFIPFFTTKDTGTGIGLSVSRYIMRLHGGNLKYHSTEGWTIFSLLF